MSEDFDAPEALSRRARRAMPLIAAAVTAIVVTGLVYLHPSSPQRLTAPLTAPSPSPSVLSARFSAVYDFVTPSIGWALVSDPPPNGARFYVLETTDGAKHWIKQLTTSSPDTGNPYIQFFDRAHGLIAVGNPTEIYRTSDAGAHWEALQVPPYPVTSMTFSDPSHGWVAEAEVNSGLTDLMRHLYATGDGGVTWIELPWPSWAAAAGKGAVGGDLQFRRPSEGWLGAGADVPTVYSTIDGGVTWQPHELPSLPPPDPTQGGKPSPPGSAFITSVTLLPGTGVIAFVDGVAQSAAYTSFDQGSTWRLIAPAPGETIYAQFVFQDAFHWWAMRFGALWKSSDAGQTWKQVGQQLDDWDYRPHVIDAKHAWAELFASVPAPRQTLPTYGLAMTSDGGVHWTQVNSPQPG